jgi:Tol biopolymer transport system component
MSGFEDPENERPEIGYHSSAIYVVELEGDGEPQRISPIEGHDGPFAWSRDGSRLLYVANRESGFDDEGDWDVLVMKADGSEKANLSSDPARDTDPVWTADEQRIVFRSDRDGQGQLYSMDARGGDVVALPRVTPYDTPLFCTPNDEIVFSAATDVWVMGMDGANPRKIASVDTGFAALRRGDVVLSPDGKTVAYVNRAGIFTVPVAGGEPTQITEGDGAFQLAWSPAAR